MRHTHTFAHLLLLLLSLLVLGACEQTLSLEEEHGGDHELAFVGGLDALGEPDADGWQSTGVLQEAQGFSRIGLRYDAGAVVSVEARFRAMGEEAVGEWLPAVLTYEAGKAHNAYLDAPFVADAAELRFLAPVEAELSFVAVELFDRMAGAAQQEDAVDVEASGTLEQGLAADGLVVTRAQWGARARSCGSTHSPSRITIHHTVTPNNDGMTMAARMRQIQSYHIDVRGYCDVGYHFLIGQDGLVYQGRPENRVGAHALGANTRNAGISFIGDYSSHEPTQAQLRAAARIMRALQDTYGIGRDRSVVKGHREVGQTATACPGQRVFNRLQEIIDLSATVDATPAPSGGSDGVPPDANAPGCYSSTVERNVDHGSCVQVSYAGCGQGSCAWYTCDAGSWQCSNRESCDEAATFPNAQCGSAPSAPVYDSCHSSTLGRSVEHGGCVQVAYPGCGQDGCAWYSCHDGSWQCTDRGTCSDSAAFRNSACPSNEAAPESEPVAQSYADLPPSHPAFEAAEALRSAGAMWGCTTGQFCPDQPIMRAEVAYLFDKLLSGSTPMPSSPLFDDVSTSDWYFEAVQKLAARGVTTGCADALFCPMEGVSRAAAAVFLRRAEDIAPNAPAASTFLDVTPGHWAYEAIEGTYAAGLVEGCSATVAQFCPSDMLTRADAALLFSRVYLE